MIQRELKGIFFLVSFALATAFVYNHFSPSGIALLGQWESSKGVVTANSKTGPEINASIEINNPETVKEIVQNKKRIVLDVRPHESYDQGHLPTALSSPLMEFDDNVDRILGSISRQAAILVYCSSIECEDSHTFAGHLINLGYEDVKVFSGGFRQWQEQGNEIEKNEE